MYDALPINIGSFDFYDVFGVLFCLWLICYVDEKLCFVRSYKILQQMRKKVEVMFRIKFTVFYTFVSFFFVHI